MLDNHDVAKFYGLPCFMASFSAGKGNPFYSCAVG